MNNLEKKFVETNYGKIFYFINKPFPNRPMVVLIHGLSSNHTTWLNTINFLDENKYNSLAIELRGHGLSDKSKKREIYNFEIFSDDLDKIIEQEQIKKSILVGYSFGGVLAIKYTILYQNKLSGLILLSANYVNSLEYTSLFPFTWLLNILSSSLAYLMLWQGRKNYLYYQHGKVKGYWHSVRDGLRSMPISINIWMIKMMGNHDYREEIKSIKVPTYIAYGRNDYFVTEKEAHDMHNAIPNSELITSPTLGHFIATNSQDEVNQMILEFLKKYAQ